MLSFQEVEGIIEQMMNVARYQHWDTVELEPVGLLLTQIEHIVGVETISASAFY